MACFQKYDRMPDQPSESLGIINKIMFIIVQKRRLKAMVFS